MSKPTVIEIPANANEQVVRIQLEELTKRIKQARISSKERITVMIKQGA